MSVRLPDPPSTGNANLDRYLAQNKQALEQAITQLQLQALMPTYSGTATAGRTKLPNADLPSRWIYAVGSATSGPAYNDGTAWRWGTGASAVVS